MKCRLILYVSLCTTILLWTTYARAQLTDNIAIHGFGGWAYGKTDNENHYLTGDKDGNYDHVNFALNVSANPYEKLSLHIQTEYFENSDDSETELDYAFAEWYVSDQLIFRIGKVKAPFMIYTEVYDVGTVRPFFTLPQGVYQRTAAEGYKGIGITGSFYTKGGWGLDYDLYGGKLTLLPNTTINSETYQFDAIEPNVDDLIGGRLTLHPPINGLNISISSYTGNFKFESESGNTDDRIFDDRYILFGTSLEYLSDHWGFRSEYLTQKDSSKARADVVYIEASYSFTEHWQAAARYEYTDFRVNIPGQTISQKSLLEHEEIAMGINYWLTANCVFKLSYHLVEGNNIAIPGDIEEYLTNLQEGSFDEKTNLILAGVQFSF